jgi:ribosomal protein S18 acetylase RimI-like enzyme
MDTVMVRTATLAEAPLVLKIVQEGFEEYRGVLNPPSGAHRETLDLIQGKMTEGGAFIAWMGETPVGAVVHEPYEGALYLGRLAVLPTYRKHGIAHLLVEAIENLARERQLPKVTLGVRTQLPGNRAFFERLGYQVIGYHSHEGYPEPTFMTLEKAIV